MPVSAAYQAFTRPWGGGGQWGGRGQPSLQHTARRRQRMRELGLIGPEPPTPLEKLGAQQDLQAQREEYTIDAEERQAEREAEAGREERAFKAEQAGLERASKERLAGQKLGAGAAKVTGKAKAETAEQQRVKGLLQDLQGVSQPFDVQQRARAELRSLGEEIPKHLEAGYLPPPELQERPISLEAQLEFAGKRAARTRTPLSEQKFLIGERGFQARKTQAAGIAARLKGEGDPQQAADTALQMLARFDDSDTGIRERMVAKAKASGDKTAKTFLYMISTDVTRRE